MKTRLSLAVTAIAALGTFGCQRNAIDVPSVDAARAFLSEANSTMLRLGNEANEAGWVQNTYITPDTEAMAARANATYMTAVTRFAKEAVRYDQVELPASERRQLTLLKNALTMAAPSDPKEAAELAQLVTGMEGAYGRGKFCADGESGEGCLDIEEITEILAKERTPARLREVWEGWHSVAPPMKQSYTRFVELSNKGAQELGFADTGAMWRSKYDMPPDAFARDLDRLWDQLRPLYLSLHAYVRAKLHDRYGDQVPATGPIPAHLLGNLWAQDWSNLYDVVGPERGGKAASLSDVLRARNVTPVDMSKYGERFFTSLGFEPLPQTFWERSLFVKPRDREVVCHASAWNINAVDDLRFKMCIDQTEEDFTVIHHELGHNFYSRAYAMQPPIFRDSANDGFHEAIGDTIALSVTPEYLSKVGLVDTAAKRPRRHWPALENRSSTTRVPAVRPGRRFVAVAGVQRTGNTRQLQSRVVGTARTLSGREARVAERRGVL